MVRIVGDMKIFWAEIEMSCNGNEGEEWEKHAVSVASVGAAGKSFCRGAIFHTELY
jgi:hypothetical protein